MRCHKQSLTDSLIFHTPHDCFARSLKGKGTFGLVVHCSNSSGTSYAIKKLKTDTDERSLLRELAILKHVKQHRFFVNFVMAYECEGSRYIVFDLMDTDLHRVIQSDQNLSKSHVKYFLFQIVTALSFLHNSGIVHRDIKPQNILINRDCNLRLADFGLARELPQTDTLRCRCNEDTSNHPDMSFYSTTRWYRSPEMILQTVYGTQIDMWSTGCVFAELLLRQALFQGNDQFDQLYCILNVLGTPSHEDICQTIISSHELHSKSKKELRRMYRHQKTCVKFVQSLQVAPIFLTNLFPGLCASELDMMSKLLSFNQHKRISAARALQHPYLNTSIVGDCQPLYFFDWSIPKSQQEVTNFLANEFIQSKRSTEQSIAMLQLEVS